MSVKRAWGIRHARWAWLSWRFWFWWDTIGHCFGAYPNPADMDYLAGVWRGEK